MTYFRMGLLALASLILMAGNVFAQEPEPTPSTHPQPDVVPKSNTFYWLPAGEYFAWRDKYSPPTVIFFSTTDQAAIAKYPHDVWHKVSVYALGVPINATFVHISGRLLAVNGSQIDQVVGYSLAWREHGTTEIQCHNYRNQIVVFKSGEGARQGMSDIVRVKDGFIEFCWGIEHGKYVEPMPITPGAYIGLNLVLTGYWKPSEIMPPPPEPGE